MDNIINIESSELEMYAMSRFINRNILTLEEKVNNKIYDIDIRNIQVKSIDTKIYAISKYMSYPVTLY